MTRELKPGQRVRVTVRNRVAHYQPGDTGTVLRSSVSPTTGKRHYTVAMDMDDPAASGAIFAEGEIEADDEG
jgi:hypothetical protein